MGGYVYIMRSDRMWFCCKIGVTGKPKYRIKSVDESMRGNVKYVVYFRFWFPYFVEGFLHWVFSPIRRRRIRGASGGTEWFYLPPVIGGLVLSIVWIVSMFMSMLLGLVFVIILIYIGNGEVEGFFGEMVKVLEECR